MKKIKAFAMAALLGGVVLGGGCLTGGLWGQLLWGSAISVATDFATDNDTVFDLFEDGAPPAAATTTSP